MKIAVCDDEPIFLEMIRKELEQYYKSLDVMIETFHSGEDLLRVIKRNPQIYRCIFLDIEMPGLSGLDTAEKVKEMGLSIPEDLSIISFNNSLFARLTSPQLTSVDINSFQLGSEAAAQMINHIEDPDLPATKILVPHHMVERDSCCPPKEH